MATNIYKKNGGSICVQLNQLCYLTSTHRSDTKVENVTATLEFYHYLVVMQYNFIMDANVELKP